MPVLVGSPLRGNRHGQLRELYRPQSKCRNQCIYDEDKNDSQTSGFGVKLQRSLSMGKIYQAIDAKLTKWLTAQHIFFVATAPLSRSGHVNCSPKDARSFRILDDRTVAYVDFTGSGVETIAHLKENGRILLMFCSFKGAPKIVRLHGRGEVIEVGHAEAADLELLFPKTVGIRSFIRIHLTRISDSCGYGVPLYDFREHRSQLRQWAERHGEEKVAAYRREYNLRSVDGLPGVEG